MIHNYAIGIGGTGARVMEAMVRLCECGYLSLDDELTCLIIDADTVNGNVLKTKKLFENYKKCQKDLETSTDRRIFKTTLSGVPSAGGTQNHFAKPFAETELEENTEISILSLAEKSRDKKAYNLMKRYFKKYEYERNLTKGLYGMPGVGTFIFAYYSDNSPVINDLLQKIVVEAQSPKTSNIRIFLAGSVFGGTGASGMPYLAKTIYNRVEELGESCLDRIEIFGCLMLPYFTYDDSEDGSKVNQDKFEMNAYESIDDYIKLKREGVFKRIYLIGDTSKPLRGRRSYEGTTQVNMPHISELFAASQARDFFMGSIGQTVNNAGFNNEVDYANPLALDGNSIKEVKWGDCAGGEELGKFVSNFITFNFYFSMGVVPLIFDFDGGASSYFKLCADPKPFAKRVESLRKMKLLDDCWVRGGRFSKRKFAKWIEDIIVAKPYIELYKYLTDSAAWYYMLTYQYRADARECITCTDSCNFKFEDALKECACSVPMLTQLFSEKGAEMLRNRSILPLWVNKNQGKRDLFWEYNRDLMSSIDKDLNLISGMHSDKSEGSADTSDQFFRKLVRELFSHIEQTFA